VATKKETTAFIERVASQASQRNSYRATFVALRPLIEGALAAGYSMKTTWEALCAEGKLTMTYETFRVHCRKAGLGSAAPGATRAQAQAEARPHAKPMQKPIAKRVDELAAEGRASVFQHSAMPQKSEIYG
jgi:hypothetical protein